jgi:AcrR family transcriptional regulator
MSGRKRTTKKTLKRDWKALACAAMAAGATVTEAAKAAGVNRTTIYAHLDTDSAFRAAFDDATEQGTDIIESEATRRAVHGVEEPVIYQGKPTLIGYDANDNPCDPEAECCVRREFFTVRKPSDTLAIFILKGRRPLEHLPAVRAELSRRAETSCDVHPRAWPILEPASPFIVPGWHLDAIASTWKPSRAGRSATCSSTCRRGT